MKTDYNNKKQSRFDNSRKKKNQSALIYKVILCGTISYLIKSANYIVKRITASFFNMKNIHCFQFVTYDNKWNSYGFVVLTGQKMEFKHPFFFKL